MPLLLPFNSFNSGRVPQADRPLPPAIDFLTFGYYLLVGLIDAEMLIDSIRLLPAMLLGFFAGSLAFGRVSEDRFRCLTLGITLAAGAFLLWSNWGSMNIL